MTGSAVLVLDFDGVICDSWRECAVVTWAAHHHWPPAEFSVTAFDAIPAAFVTRFLALRGYARHLGHFLVPVLAVREQIGPRQISGQDDFERYYATLAPDAVADFITRASAYRAAARDGQRAHWLALHALYEGVASLLSELADRLYIVTARDSVSVRELLGSHGITIEPERIYGDQQSKGPALADIRSREGTEIYFVDDSLGNVFAAQADGHRAAWALWGYSAPEHRCEALRLRVPALSLRDLPATAVAIAGTRAARPSHEART